MVCSHGVQANAQKSKPAKSWAQLVIEVAK